VHRLDASQNFATNLKRALAVADEPEQLRELRALAQLELNYVQSIQFDRALQQLGAGPFDELPRCRLAILSSSTVDHLLPPLKVAGFRRGMLLDLHITPFGQYRQELLNPDSALAQFQPQVILFSLSARDILSSVPISASASRVDQHVNEHVADLVSLWQAAQQMPGTTVLQQTFLNIGESLFGSLDRSLPSAPTQVIRRYNQYLVEAATSTGVVILDLDRPVEKYGLQFWFDNAKWLQAKIEISPAASMQYADFVSRIVASLQGLSKKCLVLDLDNTLWGGVVGDAGIDNISLGEGSGLGEAYQAFQRYIKQLQERGIILAVCSKNEQQTAESVFRNHSEMVLKLEDITAFVANWENKATNLIRIAEQLNIGIDSLVFVDDNPAERALIRQSLPMVAVPEMPEDPSRYVQCLSDAGYFESVSFTGDDLQRNAQYAANNQREALSVTSQSIDDYLESLRMSMAAGPFEDVDMPRIAQLINKTNQFNTTTRRRTLDEVRAIASAPEYLTLQARLSDRFGDNGLISAVIIEPVQQAPGTYEIETWVMSCRVFGRQLEYEIMNSLVALAKKAGARRLLASYKPTSKNALIKNLYTDLGFEPLPVNSSGSPDEMRWSLDLEKFNRHTTHIGMRSK
jgi:FkbH-like protein